MQCGFQAKDVIGLTNLSYRQIDYWVRNKFIIPRTIQKGSRRIRIFSFDNLVVIRAAMKLLDFGLGFPVVKKAATWLQEAFESGAKGDFLFVANGDNLTFLCSDTDEILQLMRGKCAIIIDLGQIISQLENDIEVLRQRNISSQRSYTIPDFSIA